MKHLVSHNRLLRKLTAVLLMIAMAAALLSACSTEETDKEIYADYGTVGSAFAADFAASYPNRSPGSEQEQAAGDYLIGVFEDLGYEPIVTSFEFMGDDGELHRSRNIAVQIKGSGFEQTMSSGAVTSFERQVIVGAHYDAPVSAEESAAADAGLEPAEGEETAEKKQSLADFDGIQDNAAAIAALVTIAREAKTYSFGYEVVLVAFGAGSAGFAGAQDFAAQLDPSDIAATDAMYCMTGIYAGDKIYAHAGRNSIVSGDQKNYEMRRKLYEATDVFYEHLLYTNNSYMLYTNQSDIFIAMGDGEDEKQVYYREWSLNESDYTPFDELGIPIVFFETYNYNETSLDEMTESQNPAFGDTNGKISGTKFDSSVYLEDIFKTTAAASSGDNKKVIADLLTRRINNTAFLILEAIEKGVHDATVK